MILTPAQELLLLHFWSLSVDVARKLPIEMRREINGLQSAIELLTNIPVAIGWEEDVEPLLNHVAERGKIQNRE